jgi:hypothetical protein
MSTDVGWAGKDTVAIVTPDAVSSGVPITSNNGTKSKPTTSQYSSPTFLSATSLVMPAMTLSTTHALMKDDLTCGSSTAAAAAFAMSSWKQDPSELAEGLSSYSSIQNSNRSMSHVDDGHDDEKRRKWIGALERRG